MPAHDVERQVFLRVVAFLESAREIMDGLTIPEDVAACTQHMISAAAKLANRLRSSSPRVVHDFLREVLRSVVVHPEKIEVEVGKRELRDLLIEAPISNCRFPNPNEEKQVSGDVIRLAIAARVKRFGGEMKLVLHADNSQQTLENRSTSLLKALARASQWHEWILAGEVSGRRSIAQKLGLDERYVYRVLACAFLAPDIVEGILNGRQPSGLSYKKLTCPLPLSWIEQRKQLGLPPLSAHS
jgi:hypothetical protein